MNLKFIHNRLVVDLLKDVQFVLKELMSSYAHIFELMFSTFSCVNLLGNQMLDKKLWEKVTIRKKS